MITHLNQPMTFAKIAFGDQKGPYGDGLFEHSLRVANKCTRYESVILGYLHDVVEDTHVTLLDIDVMFGEPTAVGVDALTHRDGETYADYIERIATSGDPFAIEAKLADLADHLEHNPEKIPPSLVDRYKKAQTRLLEAQATTGETDWDRLRREEAEGIEPTKDDDEGDFDWSRARTTMPVPSEAELISKRVARDADDMPPEIQAWMHQLTQDFALGQWNVTGELQEGIKAHSTKPMRYVRSDIADKMLEALKVAGEALLRGTVHEDLSDQANRERAHSIVTAAINAAEKPT